MRDKGKQKQVNIIHPIHRISKSYKFINVFSAFQSSICRKVLPALVGLLLHCSTEKHIETMSTQINNFFDYIWEHTFEDKVESTNDSSHVNSRVTNVLDVGQKMVIQYMLDIVDFVRLQRQYYKPRYTFFNRNLSCSAILNCLKL